MEQLLICRSTILSDSIETRSFIDHAFDLVLSKHRNRQRSFALLASYLDATGGQAHIKRFAAILERLPSIIEYSEYEEHANLLHLVLVMANHPDLFQHWNSMSSKLIPVINRLLNQNKKTKTVLFIASFLSILASMRTKSILTSHLTNLITTIKQLLWQCMTFNSSNSALVQHFVHLLALLYVIRPSTIWMDSFRVVVAEMRSLALEAGLTSDSSSTCDSEVIPAILRENIDGLSGVKKALVIKEAFAVEVELLTQVSPFISFLITFHIHLCILLHLDVEVWMCHGSYHF